MNHAPGPLALIVDDSAVDRSVLYGLVRRSGVEFAGIEVAASGGEALDRFKTMADGSRPLIVFLDLDMPVMGGLDALSAIRVHEQEHDLPAASIVVVSALDDVEIRKDCYASGADAFHPKPIQVEKLRQILNHELSIGKDGT